MKIYLVRHGMDEEGFRGGWSQRGLTDQGIIQSQKLAKHIKNNDQHYGIHTIISSDLPRAVQTTKEIEQILQVKTLYLEEWREMNNGHLAGMPNNEAEVKYPGVYFNTLQMNTSFAGGESPSIFYNRICESFDELCKKLEHNEIGPNVLLVTHGGVINVLYYYLEGREWTNKSEFYPIDNTSVHTVEKRQDRWKITGVNDTRHLN
ncbi:histidine phosphatase family protein [Paenibacillus puldeungensis]|uniref:Histidine phosphatase family protein n=1 Tax=Paenibacillus puldeungensis TaxID=696536 RepID=A0ABW3RVW5_9BACL